MLHRILALSLLLVACGGIDDADDDGPLGGSLTLEGTVVDFQTNAAVTGAVSVTASGLVPAPTVIAQGAEFTIEGIPENSAFQILAAAPPTHRATFTSVIELTRVNVMGVKAPIIAESFLASLATAFDVTPSAATGIVLVALVDTAGNPRAGLSKGELVIPGANGPHFLDENMMPAPNANSSTASGWAVFFEVPAGVAAIAQPANKTIAMATSPINPGTVTLATAVISDGPPNLPTNVSFSATVRPIFATRGCEACHSGNGPGKDLGNLTLDGGTPKIYSEVVTERPNARVNVAMPALSRMLTMPSRETPADNHPNITFASAQDPDYIKILVWITEGARDN
jgi:hypothetical protein